jgi:hypothetical protein
MNFARLFALPRMTATLLLLGAAALAAWTSSPVSWRRS